jgi:hypothetical protein
MESSIGGPSATLSTNIRGVAGDMGRFFMIEQKAPKKIATTTAKGMNQNASMKTSFVYFLKQYRTILRIAQLVKAKSVSEKYEGFRGKGFWPQLRR